VIERHLPKIIELANLISADRKLRKEK
jgi:hypothetical protein